MSTDDVALELTVEVEGGGIVRLRPIGPGDKDALQDGMHHLSPQSRYFRFFSPVQELSAAQLRYFTELDYHDHFAFGAFVDEPEPAGVGVARYIRLRDEPTVAEFAVAVVDDWQGRGLGPLLLGAVCVAARHNGFEQLRGAVMRTNAAMVRMLEGFGAVFAEEGMGEVRATIDPTRWVDQHRGQFTDDIDRLVVAVAPPPGQGRC